MQRLKKIYGEAEWKGWEMTISIIASLTNEYLCGRGKLKRVKSRQGAE